MRTFLSTAALLTAIVLIYAADAQTVTIRTADCAHLVRHAPAPDVAYQPGIDVRGRRVVPAEVEGGVTLDLPEAFAIPINVDLQKRLGIPADPAQFQTRDFTVGTVTWKNGQGYFNGQPLQSEEATRLAALCQERLGRGR